MRLKSGHKAFKQQSKSGQTAVKQPAVKRILDRPVRSGPGPAGARTARVTPADGPAGRWMRRSIWPLFDHYLTSV